LKLDPARDTAVASRARLWPGALAFWAVLGLLESSAAWLRTRGTLNLTWPTALKNNMPWWLLWAALMPVAFRLSRWLPLSGRRWPRNALLHLAAALAVSSAHLVVEGVIYFHSVPRGIYPSQAAVWRQFFNNFIVLDVVTYFAIVGAWHAFDLHGRYQRSALQSARLELGLSEARMQALRAELNPHFFFNALNAVSGLVRREENDAAVTLLARLGELLSATLDHARPAEIPLREELDLLDRYLAIERARFGDRLTVRIHHDGAADTALVPTFILQPLVENAIRHGIARQAGQGRVEVRAWREGDALLVAVQDSGAGVASPRGEGIGLSNTRARLEGLYGSAASLVLENGESGGACARIRLPYRASPAERADAS
jgi:two-component system LytT family sensor kinase